MQTWIDLPFADGSYTFKLGLDQIKELEKKSDAGLGRIFARVMAGRRGYEVEDVYPDDADYRFGELVEIIRQSLIGGARCYVDGEDKPVSSGRADELVARYLTRATDGRMEVKRIWALAAAILGALVEGYSPPGEVGAGESPAA